MRHSKSRFIEEARRVGTGAVENRTYRGWGESVHLFFEFTIYHTEYWMDHRYLGSKDYTID